MRDAIEKQIAEAEAGVLDARLRLAYLEGWAACAKHLLDELAKREAQEESEKCD